MRKEKQVLFKNIKTMNKENNLPDYVKIYSDMIHKKYPDKKQDCMKFLMKNNLSALDVLALNKKIFGISDKKTETINRKHRSYSKKDILEILAYQKKHNLNNSQLAEHFKLSRNTVSKWKSIFVV